METMDRNRTVEPLAVVSVDGLLLSWRLPGIGEPSIPLFPLWGVSIMKMIAFNFCFLRFIPVLPRVYDLETSVYPL